MALIMRTLMMISWLTSRQKRSLWAQASHVQSIKFMMIEFKDFAILSWNVRGFANKRSHHHMGELLHRVKPDLVFVFETHTQFATVERFWDRAVGYSPVALEEAHGHSGGIGILRCKGSL